MPSELVCELFCLQIIHFRSSGESPWVSTCVKNFLAPILGNGNYLSSSDCSKWSQGSWQLLSCLRIPKLWHPSADACVCIAHAGASCMTRGGEWASGSVIYPILKHKYRSALMNWLQSKSLLRLHWMLWVFGSNAGVTLHQPDIPGCLASGLPPNLSTAQDPASAH